jgi:hypothetical protein
MAAKLAASIAAADGACAATRTDGAVVSTALTNRTTKLARCRVDVTGV